jgi:hypothetical protein
VQAVLGDQADHAIEEVRGLRDRRPDHILLNEEYLRRLAISLRWTWDFTQDAMPVIGFRAELDPESVDAQRMLADQ